MSVTGYVAEMLRSRFASSPSLSFTSGQETWEIALFHNSQ